MRTAVVTGENHQGVVVQTLVSERLQHASYVAIEVAHHGGVNTQRVIFNVRKGCVVFLGGLQGRVRRGVGQVQKEGLLAIGLNGFFGFISEVICHIALGLERFTAIKVHAKAAGCPLKFINDVKGLLSVHHIGVVFRQVKRAAMLE